MQPNGALACRCCPPSSTFEVCAAKISGVHGIAGIAGIHGSTQTSALSALSHPLTLTHFATDINTDRTHKGMNYHSDILLRTNIIDMSKS